MAEAAGPAAGAAGAAAGSGSSAAAGAAAEDVQYKCVCGFEAAIYNLYWCRHCTSIRCGRCSLQEIDSYFCPSCLDEHMPSTEAKLNKNRCSRCMECPLCLNTLATVAGPDATPDKESFVLVCNYCYWSSASVGISGTQAEIFEAVRSRHLAGREAKINSLTEFYQKQYSEASRERELARQSVSQALYRKGRTFTRYQFSRATQSHSQSECAQRCRVRSNQRYNEARNEWEDIPDMAEFEALQAKRVSKPKALDAHELAAITSIDQVATLAQRHSLPASQPNNMAELTPAPKKLLAKRSKRCKTCWHNVVKPELSPTSIKYKMQLFALHNVPLVTLASAPALKLGETTKIVVTLTNPLETPLAVTLREKPVLAPDTNPDDIEDAEVRSYAIWASGLATMSERHTTPQNDAEEGADGGDGGDDKKLLIGTTKNSFPPMATSSHDTFVTNADVVFPADALTIAEHDPVKDYAPDDDQSEKYQDDPAVVANRRANSLSIYVPVTPRSTAEPVTVSFVVGYDYATSGPALRSAASETAKEQKDTRVFVRVRLHLGYVALE